MGDVSKPNSLSTLLGEYMSDSDNEEDQQSAKSQKNGSGTSTATKKTSEARKQPHTTHWTECLDPNTGHPYYWNTETKEVTWDKPTEYTNYLNYMKSLYTILPEDSWSVGYSDDTQIPYYVNEITRVVSWEKPTNFKEKPSSSESTQQDTPKEPSNTKPREKLAETGEKRNKPDRRRKQAKRLPKHLQKTESDDEKIELISEYAEPETSTDDEARTKQESKPTKSDSKKAPNLVAAYASDSDSNGSNKTARKRVKKTNSQEKPAEKIDENNSSRNSSPIPNINTTSFASIITGGNPIESNMDDELSKFKEEIEKDLKSLESAAEAAAEKEANRPQESNFDEKTFQRKRRIQFLRTKGEVKSENDQSPVEGGGDEDCDTVTIENSNSDSSVVQKAKKKFINFQKSHVEFEAKSPSEAPAALTVVYGPQPESPENSQEAAARRSLSPSDRRSEHKVEIDDLCDVIGGKVKFLSIGKAEVSAVQIMSIQLEALQSAFRASCLDSDYFFKWLKTTADDLTTLEQNAAPDGWECKWDRENSQYCYKNLKTNEMQLEFPCGTVQQETDVEEELKKVDEVQVVVRGEDEMDISTTPPPAPSPPNITGHQWDSTNPIVQLAYNDTAAGQADISGELASFYSDIATIDLTAASTVLQPTAEPLTKSNDTTNASTVEDAKKPKKRKKIKVPGLASKMQEVSTMVANWQKAQKELEN